VYDPTVHIGKIATIACWAGAFVVLFAAWMVGMFGDWEVAVMLGFTSTALLAGGVVLSARGYTARVMKLMRACERRGTSAAEDAELHSIR
jgi:hypothetical protein